MIGGGAGTPSATRLGGFLGGMIGGGAGTPSATRLGGFLGGIIGGGAGTPSATRLGGFLGGMMGGGAGTPSATRLGGFLGGIIGGGAGTPSAWLTPLFQVGNMRELLTGTTMASRIRLTESATESVSRTFFTWHAPSQEGCQLTKSLVQRVGKSSADRTRFRTGRPGCSIDFKFTARFSMT